MIDNLVDIIIPVYKSERFIKRCLTSMLNQTYKDIEVTVVYDVSPDNTFKILQEFEGEINIIKQNRKTSPAIAMNLALNKTDGEFIAFCGSDDFFEVNKIERQVDFLKKYPEIGLVYTDAYVINQNGEIIKKYRCPEWNRKEWLRNQYIIMSSVLLRRDVLEKAGAYHDEKLSTCEDLELLIRLSNVTNFKRIPEFLTYYTIHRENLSKEQLYRFDIDRIRVFYKHRLIIPLFHSLFILFRNQIIARIPVINTTYEKVSKKIKKQHFWEDEA